MDIIFATQELKSSRGMKTLLENLVFTPEKGKKQHLLRLFERFVRS